MHRQQPRAEPESLSFASQAAATQRASTRTTARVAQAQHAVGVEPQEAAGRSLQCARATIGVSIDLDKDHLDEAVVPKANCKLDAEAFEPFEAIGKDMVDKSLTTAGKYYYTYFRSGARQFVQRLIGWRLRGHIQLCIMTAANKPYMAAIMSTLLNCAKFERYFDCIVTKQNLPLVEVAAGSASDSSNQCKYRRVKSLDLIYGHLDCDRSVPCIMVDDNLRNFDLLDKLKYVYNIVEFRHPREANERYLDSRLFSAQTYIESVALHRRTIDGVIESELEARYKQYLVHRAQSDPKFKLMDRYLMSGPIRIKKLDGGALSSECELLATLVLFYRLYFAMSGQRSTAKYFSANFDAFLLNLYFDGRQLMRRCAHVFGDLTVVAARSTSKKTETEAEVAIQIKAKIMSVQGFPISIFVLGSHPRPCLCVCCVFNISRNFFRHHRSQTVSILALLAEIQFQIDMPIFALFGAVSNRSFRLQP